VALTVVLPTYEEAGNIRAVVTEVQRVLESVPNHEILVVDDDSPDRTWAIVDLIETRDPRVRCYRRMDERGLASAIVDGLRLGRGDVLVVMDADLQHEPETILPLLAAVESADIAVASRYVEGGSVGEWGSLRRWVSKIATVIGQRALGVSASDPMSGFFAIRKPVFEAVESGLKPRGFKALLEILYQAENAEVVEVPYEFRTRMSGRSKLGGGVVIDYLRTLVSLRAKRVRLGQLLRYLAVGASGVLVQLSVLQALLTSGMNGSVPVALAIGAAMISNFGLNNLWTFRAQQLVGSAFGWGLARFMMVSTVGALLNLGTTMSLHALTGRTLLLTSLAGIGVATLWNFEMNRRWTWSSQLPSEANSEVTRLSSSPAVVASAVDAAE